MYISNCTDLSLHHDNHKHHDQHTELVLETRSHGWVPAGHPQYTRAPEREEAVGGSTTHAPSGSKSRRRRQVSQQFCASSNVLCFVCVLRECKVCVCCVVFLHEFKVCCALFFYTTAKCVVRFVFARVHSVLCVVFLHECKVWLFVELFFLHDCKVSSALCFFARVQSVLCVVFFARLQSVFRTLLFCPSAQGCVVYLHEGNKRLFFCTCVFHPLHNIGV